MIWLVALGVWGVGTITLFRCLARGDDVAVWALRCTGVPFVVLRDGVIHDRSPWRHRCVALTDLVSITYDYQAVVGFVAVWVFTARGGAELVVPSHRAGLDRLVGDLERVLPPFSRAAWKQAFADGDVEDSLVVWQSPDGARSNDVG